MIYLNILLLLKIQIMIITLILIPSEEFYHMQTNLFTIKEYIVYSSFFEMCSNLLKSREYIK